MVRVKEYLDINVLEAAIGRIHHIHDLHDTVAVAFSGGKDSLAVLHLAIQVARERGKLPVRVIFRDEELIPDSVIDFVNQWRQNPDIAMDWWAVAMRSQKYILGTSRELTLWDEKRKWLRPKPEWAITEAPGLIPGEPVDQYTLDDVTAAKFVGRVAIMTGIRAAESLMRFRASVNKLNDNYINATGSKRIFLCKPIFDWQENDIFKFFMEREIRYCPIYDSQHVSGSALRVATPLHAEQSKRIGLLRSVSPVFYGQIMDIFPEMLVQERYYCELDNGAIRAKYGQSIDGIRQWIIENIQDEKGQRAALERLDGSSGGSSTGKRLHGIALRHQRNPTSYPLSAILKYFQAGVFKRELLPQGNSK